MQQVIDRPSNRLSPHTGILQNDMTVPSDTVLNFVLPTELEAREPPEARGLERDMVRLMVSHYATDQVTHATFRDIPALLTAGDLLVLNTSGTMNASLPAVRNNGDRLELHLSTHLPADLWIVELRQPGTLGSQPFFDARRGEELALPAGAVATLLIPYRSDTATDPAAPHRLWVAAVTTACPLPNYLARHGSPIRYSYVGRDWPSSYYQNVYATEVGSAEMPSAGRAFTPAVLAQLVARGVQIAPLVLHTGVASLEADEAPYEEFYRVPLETARLVNAAHAASRSVVAVGTTVVRALETVTDTEGTVHPGEGWTRLVISPQRGVRAVTALLTGFHEPRASHLAMLEAIAGREHLRRAYAEALRARYLWHEFGDLHLLTP